MTVGANAEADLSTRIAAIEAILFGNPAFLTAPPQLYVGTGAPSDHGEPQGSIYLRTDGGAGTTLYTKTGASTWTAASTIAVAGSTTQVQYNSSGSLAGNAALTFASSTGKLSATILSGIQQNTVSAASGSTDALPLGGDVFITTAGVDATTLATPTATTDDGKILFVIDTGGHAHTITTAANKIAPSHDTVTFNGTVGSFVILEAYQGLWYVRSSSGVTFSEA